MLELPLSLFSHGAECGNAGESYVAMGEHCERRDVVDFAVDVAFVVGGLD